MKKLNFLVKVTGSFFFTGYAPFAPGTVGSFLALLIYWFIPHFEHPLIIIPIIVETIVLGILSGNVFDKHYKKDPPQCTIDEAAGMWISLLFLPKIWWVAILSFFVWRLFDIIKPFPARRLEKLSGGLGIMADDIMAGVYSLLLLHIILLILNP